MRGFERLKQYLPPDLPGWSRFDPTEGDGPLRIVVGGARRPVDIAAAREDGRFVVVPFGIRDPLVLVSSDGLHVDVLRPSTGERLVQRTLARGEELSLPVEPALVIIARRAARD